MTTYVESSAAPEEFSMNRDLKAVYTRELQFHEPHAELRHAVRMCRAGDRQELLSAYSVLCKYGHSDGARAVRRLLPVELVGEPPAGFSLSNVPINGQLQRLRVPNLIVENVRDYQSYLDGSRLMTLPDLFFNDLGQVPELKRTIRSMCEEVPVLVEGFIDRHYLVNPGWYAPFYDRFRNGIKNNLGFDYPNVDYDWTAQNGHLMMGVSPLTDDGGSRQHMPERYQRLQLTLDPEVNFYTMLTITPESDFDE
jgi:hypothetical protein